MKISLKVEEKEELYYICSSCSRIGVICFFEMIIEKSASFWVIQSLKNFKQIEAFSSDVSLGFFP